MTYGIGLVQIYSGCPRSTTIKVEYNLKYHLVAAGQILVPSVARMRSIGHPIVFLQAQS